MEIQVNLITPHLIYDEMSNFTFNLDQSDICSHTNKVIFRLPHFTILNPPNSLFNIYLSPTHSKIYWQTRNDREKASQKDLHRRRWTRKQKFSRENAWIEIFIQHEFLIFSPHFPTTSLLACRIGGAQMVSFDSSW